MTSDSRVRRPRRRREGLIERFELSGEEAQAISTCACSGNRSRSERVRAEHAELIKLIADLRAILGDPSRIDGVIVDELGEIEQRYGDERRTEIAHFEGDLNVEDVIADQQMVISITRSGYVKRLPLITYRRSGAGAEEVMV